MKFTSILSTITLGALATVAAAVPLHTRDVWTPKLTFPAAGTVVNSGDVITVTWDTSDQPAQITNPSGFILLRTGEIETPVILARDFDLRDGKVNMTVPDVISRDDFSLVLFGDSGNWGEQFTIKGPLF